MAFHPRDDPTCIIMKNQREQIRQRSAVRGVSSEHPSGVLAPSLLLQRRLRRQPPAFAQYGKNVLGIQDTRRANQSIRRIIRGHQQDCSGPWSARVVVAGLQTRSFVPEVSVATTCAAIASPRPIASTPSLVL